MKKDIKLLEAIENKDLLLIEEILKISSPNVQNHDKSALMLAIEHDNFDAMEMLLNHKLLKINAQNKEGLTALHLAVKKNNPLMIAMLSYHGADYYIKDNSKKRPYDYLSEFSHLGHQTLKKQNKEIIHELFYHSGFRAKKVDEPLIENPATKKKVKKEFNQNFINKAQNMYELYENNNKEYLKQRSKYLNHTIIKYLHFVSNIEYAKNLIKYLKPNLNFFKENENLEQEHIFLNLIKNPSTNILKAIVDVNACIDLTNTNNKKETLLHAIINNSHYGFEFVNNKQYTFDEFSSFLRNQLKKTNVLEYEDKDKIIPFAYLNAYHHEKIFELVFKLITEDKLFDINKKHYYFHNKSHSFLEMLEGKSNSDLINSKLVNFCENLKAFDEKERLEKSITLDEVKMKSTKVKI